MTPADHYDRTARARAEVSINAAADRAAGVVDVSAEAAAPICPACGAAKVLDENPKEKYRDVKYDCGAEGYVDTQYGGGPFNWQRSCPTAMDALAAERDKREAAEINAGMWSATVAAHYTLLTEAEAARDRLAVVAAEMAEAVTELLPGNLGEIRGAPDAATFPVDMTAREIRRARTALAAYRAATVVET